MNVDKISSIIDDGRTSIEAEAFFRPHPPLYYPFFSRGEGLILPDMGTVMTKITAPSGYI